MNYKVFILLFIIIITTCSCTSNLTDYSQMPMENNLEETASSSHSLPQKKDENEEEAWMLVYRNFILNNEYEDLEFPTKGLYLMDLNQDTIPELLIHHSSGGSKGGYYSFYCYDNNDVKQIMNNEGDSVRCGTELQIRFYPNMNKLILYHEMTMVLGNSQDTYGYLREVINKDDVPFVTNIIKVEEAPDLDMETAQNANYENEDELVINENLALAQKFQNNQWLPITGSEYIQQKYDILNQEKPYADYWKNSSYSSLSTYRDTVSEIDKQVRNIPTGEELADLFSQWHNKTYSTPVSNNFFQVRQGELAASGSPAKPA